MFEGVGYRSGWRGMLHGGVGTQTGLSRHVYLAPEIQIMRRLGGDQAGRSANVPGSASGWA